MAITDRNAHPTEFLQQLLDRFRERREGKVADYIPELANIDPDHFAIAMATVDGQVWAVGDHEHQFSIQSISKPFVYGLALDTFGRQAVHRKVSVEPTGEAFNSIVELEEDHLPYNPMINSGAIAMSALLHHADPENAQAQIMQMFSDYLGRKAGVHEAVEASELEASYRNKAIAYLLRHFHVIGDDIDGALELYAHQCSVSASTGEIALMAATLANGGVHPVTGASAVRREHLRDIVTLMFTCGMYDTSGTWAYTVGIPAKSGVAGGIIGVVPGKMGLAVYSPRLNEHGHSVRGVEVFRAWSAEWGLSLFDV
jgi:glutaminase